MFAIACSHNRKLSFFFQKTSIQIKQRTPALVINEADDLLEDTSRNRSLLQLDILFLHIANFSCYVLQSQYKSLQRR